jgi:putative membrane protein
MKAASSSPSAPPGHAAPAGIKRCGILFAKGFCMGAADVVPGVSGGTMALVLGIYAELLRSIKAFDLHFFGLLARLQIGAALRAIPLPFLVSLFGGVLFAIFTLAKALSWLLAHHPVGIWSFFFGLILSSALMVGRRIANWTPGATAGLVLSAVVAYVVVGIVPTTTPDSRLFLFICGAIAICAMVLPGISGSFILVLLGKYHTVLEAVHRFDLATLLVFGTGAATGLMLFVRLLNWLLERYHTLTLACLTGLMIGSLRKIWPWKMAATTDGGLQAINVLPREFNTQFVMACVLALVGMLFVAVLQWLASRER